jgi:hypothetical protein
MRAATIVAFALLLGLLGAVGSVAYTALSAPERRYPPRATRR